jgi:holliday junction DNA helicase RuvA
MIARITGRLEEVTTTAALLDVSGGLSYEVLVPACDIGRLSTKLGQEILLHTIHIVEGDPSRGALTPRLIGFLHESDRAFFRAFTTVKGIGVRKALRALVRPIAEIAAAIEAKDDKLLRSLPEIGKRTAETVIAELHGKVEEFAGEYVDTPDQPAGPELSDAAGEALAVLLQLGEKRLDAIALLERVAAVAPELESAEDILQHVYKIKAKP